MTIPLQISGLRTLFIGRERNQAQWRKPFLFCLLPTTSCHSMRGESQPAGRMSDQCRNSEIMRAERDLSHHHSTLWRPPKVVTCGTNRLPLTPSLQSLPLPVTFHSRPARTEPQHPAPLTSMV